MTNAVLNPSLPSLAPVPSGIAEIFRREPVMAGAGLFLAALALPMSFAMALDPRTLLDVDIWLKPLKFTIALSIYLFTLAWYAGWLPQEVAASRRYRLFSAAVVFCTLSEIVWIGGAAVFGQASHFNVSTPFMAAIYSLMGFFAMILTSASLVFGLVILRDGKSRLNPVFRLSLGLGLTMTFALTAIVAGYMAGGSSHFVGGNASDAEALPVLGWARDGGDLRVAHFFATHALHVIPVFGYLASRAAGGGIGRGAVLAFSASYCFFVAYVFAQALAGRPFPPMIG